MKRTTPKKSPQYYAELNKQFSRADAESIIRWAADSYRDKLVIKTNFGIQSAVVLHIVSRLLPEVPVVFLYSGELPSHTYDFAQELEERLNLKVYCYWLEPMQKALADFGAVAWISEQRRISSKVKTYDVIETVEEGTRISPILNWSNRDLHRYLVEYDLPYHPLWETGHKSVEYFHERAAKVAPF